MTLMKRVKLGNIYFERKLAIIDHSSSIDKTFSFNPVEFSALNASFENTKTFGSRTFYKATEFSCALLIQT